MMKRSAAMAALLVFATIPSGTEAAPRSRATSAAAKKAAAAKTEAARLAAALAAQRAAAAEAEARMRAQWGLLADLPDGDFEANGTLVTVRREDGGNSVAMTVWKSIGRLSYRFRRDPSTGVLTYDYRDGWNDTQYGARISADGSVEAVMKNEMTWPVLKREAGGAINFAYAPGKKMLLANVNPTGKAASKLAKLVADGKVTQAGVGAGLEPTAIAGGGASADGVGATSAIKSVAAIEAAEALARFRAMEGTWSNGDYLWTLTPGRGGIDLAILMKGASKASPRRIALDGDRLTYGGAQMIAMQDGVFVKGYNFLFQPAGDGFTLTAGKLKDGVFRRAGAQSGDLGTFRRLDGEALAQWRARSNEIQMAEIQRKQQSKSSSSGWLGGLAAGFGAAMAGGDAGMVMGAAMKGVEMTTDNDMTRNVMAGQGDAMIRSSIDTQNQKAELERLRIAAQDETRRNREAAEREAANARAAENAMRVAAANDRQQAIADAYAARQAADAKAKREQASRDQTARAQRLAEQKQRDADVAALARSAQAANQFASSARPTTSATSGTVGGTGSGCPLTGKPGPTPTPCDPGPRVPIYGHFVGISMISRADAEADAMAGCAKAGKSCHVVEVIGGNGRHWRVEVAYATGEYRRVSTGASRVSGQ